jgi:outer membrane protein assembly factor BamD (BamD/ComL family)
MKTKLILLLTTIAVSISSFSQYKNLRKAREAILEGDSTKALEKISASEKDTTINGGVNFIKSFYLTKFKSSKEDCKIALNDYKIAAVSIGKMDAKGKEKIFNELGFSETDIAPTIRIFYSKLFKFYAAENNVDSIKEYLKVYELGDISIRDSAIALRDSLAYDITNKKNTEFEYQNFIKEYPISKYLDDAKSNLCSLAYKKALTLNSQLSYSQFINRFPNSVYKSDIERKLDGLIWDSVKSINLSEAYNKFINEHPSSGFSAKAKEIYENLIWDSVKAKNTSNGYEDFIKKFPNSNFLTLANEQLKQIKENTVSYTLIGFGNDYLSRKKDAINMVSEYIPNIIASDYDKLDTFLNNPNITHLDLLYNSPENIYLPYSIFRLQFNLKTAKSYLGENINSDTNNFSNFATLAQIINDKKELEAISWRKIYKTNILKLLSDCYNTDISTEEPKLVANETRKYSIRIKIKATLNKKYGEIVEQILAFCKSYNLDSAEIATINKIGDKTYPFIISRAILETPTKKDVFYLRDTKVTSSIYSINHSLFFTILNNLKVGNNLDTFHFGKLIEYDKFKFRVNSEFPYGDNEDLFGYNQEISDEAASEQDSIFFISNHRRLDAYGGIIKKINGGNPYAFDCWLPDFWNIKLDFYNQFMPKLDSSYTGLIKARTPIIKFCGGLQRSFMSINFEDNKDINELKQIANYSTIRNSNQYFIESFLRKISGLNINLDYSKVLFNISKYNQLFTFNASVLDEIMDENSNDKIIKFNYLQTIYDTNFIAISFHEPQPWARDRFIIFTPTTVINQTCKHNCWTNWFDLESKKVKDVEWNISEINGSKAKIIKEYKNSTGVMDYLQGELDLKTLKITWIKAKK